MQYPPSGMLQQGAHYMQAQQAQQMTQQQLMAARSSLLYAQQPYAALQQQQALHSQLGMSSSATPAGLHMLQSDAGNVGGGSATMAGGFPDFVRGSTGEGLHGGGAGGRGIIGCSKQDIGGSSEGRGGSSSGHTGEGGETLYLKSADDGN